MRTVGKMCLDLAIGVLRTLFEKAPVRQGRFGAKFAKRQLFFDTQIFLFRIQKVIFGIHTAVRQGFNVGFCQSKCSVVFSFGVFSSTFQVGPIDHCQRPVKHTNCLPVTFTRAKLVRPWKSPCRKSMGLVSSQCKELFWYKPWIETSVTSQNGAASLTARVYKGMGGHGTRWLANFDRVWGKFSCLGEKLSITARRKRTSWRFHRDKEEANSVALVKNWASPRGGSPEEDKLAVPSRSCSLVCDQERSTCGLDLHFGREFGQEGGRAPFWGLDFWILRRRIV